MYVHIYTHLVASLPVRHRLSQVVGVNESLSQRPQIWLGHVTTTSATNLNKLIRSLSSSFLGGRLEVKCFSHIARTPLSEALRMSIVNARSCISCGINVLMILSLANGGCTALLYSLWESARQWTTSSTERFPFSSLPRVFESNVFPDSRLMFPAPLFGLFLRFYKMVCNCMSFFKCF